ncbi:MAG TPA: polyprenyl synthetase family protein [Thermoanaerobaculia bacterium]|nr:polyprenyl synthetase family protein [Thermoanaerobaculia bacterium]
MGRSMAATSAARSEAAPTSFSQLLDSFREKLDRELQAWLSRKREAAGGFREAAELIDGVGQLVLQGGKRLRPALVYATYTACGGPADAQVLPLALATELLHTYLLIHDDIMDHAEIRRGQPAAHERFRQAHQARGFHGDALDFGRSVAILLGDLAHSWAVELVTGVALAGGLEGDWEGGRARELMRCFATMSEEVIGGQYLELLVAQRRGEGGRRDPAEREQELLRVLRLKSGRYTAERPIQLGGLLAGAPAATLAGLSRYGTAVGEAFQLQDDLLGMFGDAGTVGKPVGEDLREGKFTFLIHHALATATAEQRRTLEAALGNPRLTTAEVARAQKILEETGARARVTEMVAERLREARAAFDSISGLAPEGRLFFEGLLDYLWERES